MMKSSPRLIFDGSQLRVQGSGDDSATLRWDTAKEILVFKDDVFTRDLIRMGFRLDDEGTNWTVDEECEGFPEFIDFLPGVFPGVRTDWFSGVAFPAFATCLASPWSEKRMELIREIQN